MRNIYFLFLFAIFLPLSIKANSTTIKGTADSVYIGKPIYFYEISDAFSGLKTLISKGTVAKDGSFELSIDISTVSMGIINIDRVNAALYLSPGEQYKVTFPKLPKDAIKTFNNSNQVDLIFNDLPSNDINNLVSRFYLQLEDFQASNINIIFTKSFRPKLYEFRKNCDSAYASAGTFMSNLVHFAFANLDNESGLNKKQILDKYLKNRVVDLKNMEYANLIKLVFDREFEQFDLLDPKKPINSIISQSRPTKDLLDELKKNDFLANDTLREIVALYSLSICYEQKKYPKGTLLRMIEELGQQSKLSSTKLLAQHYAIQLKQFDKGTLAYNFTLKDAKGKDQKLSTFAGKPTLLVFWATWSQVAFNEMKLLETIYPKFSSSLNLVNISVDDNLFDYNKFVNQNSTLKGLFLNYANDKYLVEAMNVLSIPQFILIDEKGRYQNDFIPAPSAGLDDYLKNYLEKK